jgi:hypothetical protein
VTLPAVTLRVVRGDPTDEELAALVVVLQALATAPATGPPAPARRAWAAPRDAVRRPLVPGPGAWRASSLPG